MVLPGRPRERRAMTRRRWAAVVAGAGLVAFAIWLALATNVDTDAEHGPTNCGRNAILVLRDGPSVDRDVALVPVGIVVGAYPTMRCLRLGVTVDQDHVVVRNILRSHRWPVQDVESFVVAPAAWWTKVDEWVAVRPKHGPDVGVSVLALPVFRFLQGPAQHRLARMNAALAEAQHRDRRPRHALR